LIVAAPPKGEQVVVMGSIEADDPEVLSVVLVEPIAD